MSTHEWAISALIVWHLVAVFTGALLDPESEHAQVAWSNGRADDDWVSGLVAPVANQLPALIEPVNDTLWTVTSPLRALTAPYRRAGALRQQWQMFTNPPRHRRYLRARYYWRGGEGRTWSTTELLFPVDGEGHARVLASFPNRFRNKAASNSLDGFFRDRREGLDRYSDALTPFLTRAERRFAQTLSPDSTLVRSELWYGSAPTPPPGHRPPADEVLAHEAAIAGYRSPATPVEVGRRRPSALDAVEREADIIWELFLIHPPASS